MVSRGRNWFWSRDPLQRLPLELVGQALAFGFGIAIFNVLIGAIPTPLAALEPALDVRDRYSAALIAVTGVPTILLIGLASLAVPTLSPTISSSLPLLHRRYRLSAPSLRHLCRLFIATGVTFDLWIVSRLFDLPGAPVFAVVAAVALTVLGMSTLVPPARTNPLHASLLVAGILAAGLAWLQVFQTLGWAQMHILTLALISAGSLVEAAVLVYLVTWLLRLRQPSELIQALLVAAENVLRHIEVGQRELVPTRPAGRRELRLKDDVTCALEEQEDLKNVIQALTQIGLRSLHEDQPQTTDLALQALRAIAELAAELDGELAADPASALTRRRRAWLIPATIEKEDAGANPAPWPQRLCLAGITAVLYASAEEHYKTVGEEAAKHLLALSLSAVSQKTGEPLAAGAFRGRIVGWTGEAYAVAFNECVQFGERWLGDVVLDSLSQLLRRLLAVEGAGWIESLQLDLRVIIAGRLAVTKDDTPSLRALLESLREHRSDARVQVPLVRAVTDLGGAALASRAYGTAAVLIDWPARFEGPPTSFASTAVDYAIGEAKGRGADRPMHSTHLYMKLYLGLVATHTLAIGLSWPTPVIEQLIDAARTVPGYSRRARFVSERLIAAVHYPEEDAERWRRIIRQRLG